MDLSNKKFLVLQAWGDVSAEDSGFGPVGEVRLLPAEDAVIRPLPWRPTHAIALCELHNRPGIFLYSIPGAQRAPNILAPFTEGVASRRISTSWCTNQTVGFPHIKPICMCTGDPWECCPRAALKSILATAQREHGLTFRVGYESEFILLRQPAPGDMQLPPPFDRSMYCQTSAFDAAAPGGTMPLIEINGCKRSSSFNLISYMTGRQNNTANMLPCSDMRVEQFNEAGHFVEADMHVHAAGCHCVMLLCLISSVGSCKHASQIVSDCVVYFTQ